MQGMALWRGTMLAMLAPVLGGCAMYAVSGQFEDSGTLFFGSAVVSPMDIGMLNVKTADGKVACSGTTRVTQRATFSANIGLQGQASATCSDGRTFKIDFVQNSETGGHGQGIDDRGNIVQLFFDLSSATARARLDQSILNTLVK